MAKLSVKEIQSRALVILEEAAGGIRWGDLVKKIQSDSAETPANTIHGATQKLFTSSKDIIKVDKGFYQLKKYYDIQSEESVAAEQLLEEAVIIIDHPTAKTVNFVEADFYASFAQWLCDVEEAVNEAVPLGGSLLKGKWGTPDVIGVRKPRADDMLKFEPQIVSAEIKIDPGQPVVAFGQAVAYRLFSHKSYIVVPRTTSEEDLSRLKSLCSIHGVGLVTFTLDKADPDYGVVVLPAQAAPDMFYANQMLKRLLEAAPKIFHKLF